VGDLLAKCRCSRVEQLGVHILKYCRRKEEKRKRKLKSSPAKRNFIGAQDKWVYRLGPKHSVPASIIQGKGT
jgi:hypothetical protein